MKLAVSASGTGAEAALDLHFGRCAHFVIYDAETGSYTDILNPARGTGSGAGIRAAQAVVGEGVRVVITGSVGPNASRVLRAAGVKCYAGTKGKVKDAVEAYKNGLLTFVEAPVQGRTQGRGRGFGRQ
ncbi:MAG: dinitrogenase iron-molybdenum cofactor biosynthesis protein [Ammonifex sp.]|jgi:predicted Fe-Mo cluster-binding NifX family protein|nr:MAG: dinitrogenase iron-molybdenum cofactor biosynthesis protein [Ammonifex sp.]